MRISKLTKGQVRKLNALRKSLGNKIADPAFSKWLKTQNSNKSAVKADPVANQLEGSLKSRKRSARDLRLIILPDFSCQL